MGLYERDYYSNEPPRGLAPSWNQRSAVENLIIVNVVIFILAMVAGNSVPGGLMNLLALHSDDLQKPWMWWRLITNGFAHDPSGVGHIFWNMLGLWMLGRAVEDRYGRAEFLKIYLSSIVVCSLGWLLRHTAMQQSGSVLGASGAICCVEMLFVYNFPRVILLLMGIIPMPAWVLGIFLVVGNMISQPGEVSVAYDVHLIGIAYATAYFFLHWNFGTLPDPASWFRATRRRMTGPKLKVHDPVAMAGDDERADQILQKIHEQGQDSLTSAEKKFMEKYSRRVRDRRDSNSF